MTKKKARLQCAHANGTGGGPRIEKLLTGLEEQLLDIIGKVAVTGAPGLKEGGIIEQKTIGLPNINNSPDEAYDLETYGVANIEEVLENPGDILPAEEVHEYEVNHQENLPQVLEVASAPGVSRR